MKEYKIGRLADKPEIKRVESAKGAFNVVNITLYIDDLGAKKDENGHRPGVPVRLTAWDEQALQLAKHDKGELVGIMGYTNLNEFESKNGQTIKQYGITVSSVFNAQTAIDISKKLNSFYKEIETAINNHPQDEYKRQEQAEEKMKIYLYVTNGYNAIAFNKKDEWKVSHTDNRGEIDGIDIYGENAIEELKDYFENNDINDFASLSGDEVSANDLKDYGEELIFITEITDLVAERAINAEELNKPTPEEQAEELRQIVAEKSAPESLESFEGFEELDSFEDFDYDLDEVL